MSENFNDELKDEFIEKLHEIEKAGEEKAEEKAREALAEIMRKQLDAGPYDDGTKLIIHNLIIEGDFAKKGPGGLEDITNIVFDMIENSSVFEEIKDSDGFKRLTELKGIYDSYGATIVDICSGEAEYNSHKDPHGYPDEVGREMLTTKLNQLLDMSKGLMNGIPGGGGYCELIDIIQDMTDKIIETIEKRNKEITINSCNMCNLSEYDITYEDIQIIALGEDRWKDGPDLHTTKRLIECLEKNEVYFEDVDKYLAWRIEYEFEYAKDQEIANYLQHYFDQKYEIASKNDIDIEKIADDTIDLFESVSVFLDDLVPISYKGSSLLSTGYKRSLVGSSYGQPSDSSSSGGSSHNSLSYFNYMTPQINVESTLKTPCLAYIRTYHDMFLEDPENALKDFEEFERNIEIAKKYMNPADYRQIEKIKKEIQHNIPNFEQNKFNSSKEELPSRDPLIIDLGGDGFTLKKIDDGVYFDLDKNGFAEKTAWADSSEGFLAIDKNKNGFIDDGGELFGDQYIKTDGTTAVSGFDALADLDDNTNSENSLKGDGIIDSKDSRFGELLIWQDRNQNGVAERTELKTLQEAGIESISLELTDTASETFENGIIRTETANVRKTNGDVIDIAEHWFEIVPHDTVEHDENGNIIQADSVDTFGNIRNLSSAIKDDKTGKLGALVEKFKTSDDYIEKRILIKRILFSITYSDNIMADSRGNNIDARELNVIEKFLGHDFVGIDGQSSPNSNAASSLKEIYNDIEGLYFNLLNSESKEGIHLNQILVNANEDGTTSLDFSLFNFDIAVRMMLGEDVDDSIYSTAFWLKQYDFVYNQNYLEEFAANYASITDYFSDIVSKVNINSPIFGSNQNDILNTLGSDDIIWTGLGDDIIIDKGGNDTYIFNLGDGNDTIYEDSLQSSVDRIIFGEGISAEDITVSREDYDMILNVGDNGDSIR
ncbi:MAG: hypothetical protein IKI56_07505, partial [Ruminococcus sp.]|nr:hypothetical protein [Ruminococcus sp.]